jgi:peptide methionine sulfoxide reductase MsrA
VKIKIILAVLMIVSTPAAVQENQIGSAIFGICFLWLMFSFFQKIEQVIDTEISRPAEGQPTAIFDDVPENLTTIPEIMKWRKNHDRAHV